MAAPSRFTHLAKLDPITRAWALVGGFLEGWAYLEFTMREAIAKALGLDPLQAVIVSSNVQFRNQINILKTAVDMAAIFPKEKQEGFVKTLEQMDKLYPVRNMMAHEAFGPSDDGKGVRFFVMRAKGKLKIPDTVWTVAQFEQQVAKIMGYAARMEELCKALVRSDLVKALAKKKTPPPLMGGLFGLGSARVWPKSAQPESGS